MRKKSLVLRCRQSKLRRKRLSSLAQWQQTQLSGRHGPTLTDGERLAYYAGYLDGEGCWYACPFGRVRLQCTNTFPYTLIALSEEFGGTISRRNTVAGSRSVYEWAITGEKAIQATQRLIPYLHEKRQQALLCIQIKHSHPHSARRHRLIADLKALKHIDYKKEETPDGEENATD